MTKHQWTFLKKGDVVDVIAPASHSPLDKMQGGIRWIESLGLVPRVPDDIVTGELFFASPLETQLRHLKEALYSDSRAIWCLRGGYGSMRLIPHLLKLKPPKRPKLFVGFSDITSLHLFFNQEWKWPTIHGRTLSQLSPENKMTGDRKFLRDMIFGKETEHVFKNLAPLNDPARESTLIEGKITGGNLRILQSSLGTSWEISPRNKILFMEDVMERGYSIDRMLEQMIQAKILHKGLKALVFGDFTEGLEKDGRDLSLEAMKRFAERVPYPVLRGLPCGHGHVNYPLPFHTDVELHLGKKARLACSYGGRR